MQLLVNNGWDIVRDNNNGKSFMGILTWTASDETEAYVSLYAGPEQDDNTSNSRQGIDLVVDHHFAPQFNAVVQLDYGTEDGAAADGGDTEWFAAGLWLIYEVSEKWNVAFRGDWLQDSDGARTSDSPLLAPFPYSPTGRNSSAAR